MAKEKKQFKTDDITVNLSQDKGCLVILDIDLSKSLTNKLYEKAIKSINKEVSLPGFRKGHAPRQMILKHYQSHVKSRWKDNLIQESYKEAVKLANIYPYSKNAIQPPELKSFDLEKGAKIKIQFEREPQVPDINPKDIEIKETKPKKVTKKQVDETLENIRLMKADWEEITKRGVKDNDYVELDILNLNQEPPTSICKDTRFEVKKGEMGEWMRKLILGKKVGDTVEGVSEQDEKSKDKDFVPTKCRITIKKILCPKLPKLDDELAKKTGVQTVDELKERVKQDLERQAKDVAKEEMKKSLDTALSKTYAFDLPKSLVEAEKQNLLNFKLTHLENADLSDEEKEKKKKTMEKEAHQEAEKRLRLAFIEQKLAQQLKLEISKDELVKEYAKQMWQTAPEKRILAPNLSPEEIRRRLIMVIVSDKVHDHLLENVKKK